MTNPVRGDLTFSALGKEWKIKLGTNAMCEVEAELGRGFDELTRNLSLVSLRAIFRAGLAQYHAEVTALVAGNIIDEIGFQEAVEILGKASMFSSPEAKATKNPPKAATKK